MASSSYLDDPNHWRDRAVEIRALAAQLSNLRARDELLQIAEDYYLLARRAADRAKTKP
jgi:hypothetical protein